MSVTYNTIQHKLLLKDSRIGIYKITSPSGRIYIGQSWNIGQREYEYYHIGSKCRQIKIANSIYKYGFDNHKFELIHELPLDVSQEVMNNYEILYWKSYKDLGFNMMNIREPGSRGKHSEETKRKLSEAHKGKIISDETRRKLSITGRGERNGFYKKTHTPEARLKISASAKGNTRWLGKTHTPEARRKIAKRVDQYTKEGVFVKRWESMTQAGLSNNVTQSAISNAVRRAQLCAKSMWVKVNDK